MTRGRHGEGRTDRTSLYRPFSRLLTWFPWPVALSNHEYHGLVLGAFGGGEHLGRVVRHAEMVISPNSRARCRHQRFLASRNSEYIGRSSDDLRGTARPVQIDMVRGPRGGGIGGPLEHLPA